MNLLDVPELLYLPCFDWRYSKCMVSKYCKLKDFHATCSDVYCTCIQICTTIRRNSSSSTSNYSTALLRSWDSVRFGHYKEFSCLWTFLLLIYLDVLGHFVLAPPNLFRSQTAALTLSCEMSWHIWILGLEVAQQPQTLMLTPCSTNGNKFRCRFALPFFLPNIALQILPNTEHIYIHRQHSLTTECEMLAVLVITALEYNAVRV